MKVILCVLMLTGVAAGQTNRSSSGAPQPQPPQRIRPLADRVTDLEKEIANLQQQLSQLQGQISQLSAKLSQPEVAAPPASPAAAPAAPAGRVAPAIQRGEKSLGKFGDVEVRLVSYGIGKVPLTTITGESESQDDLLMVRLEITNLSQTKKANYTTWRGGDFSFGSDFAAAKDSFGNILKRISFGLGDLPKGSVKSSDSIYPGKSLTDVLVFEKPVDGATSIDVEMPASNVGAADGKIPCKL